MFWKKTFLIIAGFLPLVWVFVQAQAGELGPDPGKELVLFLGVWSLRFLILVLAVSPMRRILGIAELLRYRRILGLQSLFYASLHLLAVLTYLLGWDFATFFEEFNERPYMALGIVAWVLMMPLGLTSTNWAIRKLKAHWRQLHQLVYIVGVLACGHFIWLVRSDYQSAAVYTFIMLLLLSDRLFVWIRARWSAQSGVAA